MKTKTHPKTGSGTPKASARTLPHDVQRGIASCAFFRNASARPGSHHISWLVTSEMRSPHAPRTQQRAQSRRLPSATFPAHSRHQPAFPVLPDIITDEVQVWLSFSRDLQVFLGRCFFAVLLQPRSLRSQRCVVCSCEGETRFAGVVSKLGGIAVLESRLKLRVCRE